MDPPVPASVLRTLDAAEGDLRLLSFKYAALAAAVAQRPQPTPGETGEGGGGGGGLDAGADVVAGAEGEGGEAEGGISEDDLLRLLDQHVRYICVVRRSEDLRATPSTVPQNLTSVCTAQGKQEPIRLPRCFCQSTELKASPTRPDSERSTIIAQEVQRCCRRSLPVHENMLFFSRFHRL